MTMKTISKKHACVKVTTTIKAGGFNTPGNHNRLVVGLSVKSGIKAGEGILNSNHNRRVLSVKSGIKAGEGILNSNHNRRTA
jgi:hypothetical protein